MNITPQPVTIHTQDGTPLAVNQFEAVSSETPLTSQSEVIIIACAMGVTQAFYTAFATWLAEQGFSVVTFDYRGMGQSRFSSLRGFKADIFDWASQDCSAVLEFTRSAYPQSQITWLGHSLGGQIFPLVEGINHVKQVITVASGTGYWRRNTPSLRKKAWWLWHLIVPVTLPTVGYFPGKRLNIIGDLPKQAMQQWRRWCMHPEYCVGAESGLVRQKFSQIDVPVHSVMLTDDEMLSERNITDLLNLFGTHDKHLQRVEPEDFDLSRIGHMGFFRSEIGKKVWRQTLERCGLLPSPLGHADSAGTIPENSTCSS